MKRFPLVLLVLTALIASSCSQGEEKAAQNRPPEASSSEEEADAASSEKDDSDVPTGRIGSDDQANDDATAGLPDISEKKVAEISAGGGTWSLFAKRASGELCLRDRYTRPLPRPANGGGSGCGYELPIDHTESSGGGVRIIDGPVTLDAAIVHVNGKDGRVWKFKPFGSDEGFGLAFYAGEIEPDAWVIDVVAYDADGKELGRKKANQTAQEYMIKSATENDD